MRAETSTLSNGKIGNPTKQHKNVKYQANSIICSKCVSVLIRKKMFRIPAEGLKNVDNKQQINIKERIK